ncbi:hypothetical protein, conserved [Leishmania tarentolae]|uniref:Uncharacterized protein n=1 Tax=Leishmania tarentolae TaxID=5689 RepID=A0A640KS88_LEITA|nr:hypothetical protein, conserved [Leishmania tarentolae]
MEALSVGFCAAALVQSLAPKEVEAWHQQWPQPTLQVVDIQRYPCTPTASCGPSRFYVAVSDSESIGWLVIPPCTSLEEAVAEFEIEMGCCVTLLSHALVTAANGLNVIVPLQVKYSNNTLRLLGQPRCDEVLFPLSSQSLLQRRDTEDSNLCSATAASQQPLHAIALRDFVDAPQLALRNWCVTVRVVWKGREYPLNSHGSCLSGSSGTRRGVCAGSPRFVFRCLLADERGDAILAAFYGGDALRERVRLHGCYRLAQGTVKWSAGESGAPSELRFVEKSVEEELTGDTTQQMFPCYASALVGEVAEQLREVAAIETAQVGEYISVVGKVVAVQSNTQVTTKRGRVWQSVVTLADSADDSATTHLRSGPFAEVTLWGEIAEMVEPALGERWVFHRCAVHLFQQRKTLSSLASTMAVKLVPRKCDDKHATMSPGWEPGGGATAAVGSVTSVGKPICSAQALKKDMQLVLDLQESSPTLPVLARVLQVVPPLLIWMCTECSWTQQSVVRSGSSAAGIPTACAHCSAAQLCPTLRLHVWLSDGLCTGLAAFHGKPAESLLDASPAEVARYAERQSALVQEMLESLVGVPVLVWLLPCGVADVFDAAQYIVTNCKRIPYISASHTLLSAIDTFLPASTNV